MTIAYHVWSYIDAQIIIIYNNICIFILKKVLSLYWINIAFKSATEKKKDAVCHI